MELNYSVILAKRKLDMQMLHVVAKQDFDSSFTCTCEKNWDTWRILNKTRRKD